MVRHGSSKWIIGDSGDGVRHDRWEVSRNGSVILQSPLDWDFALMFVTRCSKDGDSVHRVDADGYRTNIARAVRKRRRNFSSK